MVSLGRQPGESSSSEALRLDCAAESWEVLSAHLDGFLNSWETAEYPPGIDEHLPGSVGILRRMVLIELIKIDLEYRHRRDVPRLLIEDYRDEFPELADGEGVPSDLIYEEFHVRKNAGESVEVNDYLQRFPEHADQLHRLFQINEPTSSSSLSGTQLHAAHKPGDRLGDFYLMSNLGTGAFGSVFLARQESMQRLVALKVSSDRGAEAQTLAQLDHPHIVRVYDQNRLPDRNLRLLYMQFVPGGTLQAVIEASRHCERPDSRLIASCVASSLSQTGVLSPDAGGHRAGVAARPWPEVVCRLGMELATALDYAHEQGILHRDLKPANVLLDVNGAAKLADFNISYSCHLESRGPAAYFGGSLAYMSPEQLEASHPKHERRPEELDGRSDLFSLGILLWEVLYGRRPFGDESVKGTWSETLLQMATLRRSGAPESPVEAMSPVEKQLVAILRRCMAPDAESRYQSARELVQDFGLCLQPRVASLIHRSNNGVSRLISRWPLSAVIAGSIGPNALAAVFNLVYNKGAIIDHLKNDTRAEDVFWNVQAVINLIAFPLAIVIGVWYLRPLLAALSSQRSPGQPRDSSLSTSVAAEHNSVGATPEFRSLDDDRLSALRYARQKSLRLGLFLAVLGITEWSIAGIAYPVSLHSLMHQGLAWEWWVHFFGSLLLCGMVVAAYPFFLVSVMSVHVFFPVLLRRDVLTSDDVTSLQRLGSWIDLFLYVSGGVPAAGILLLMSAGHIQDSQMALVVLSTLGAIGFGMMLGLSRNLKADIEAFCESAKLLEDINRSTSSVRATTKI